VLYFTGFNVPHRIPAAMNEKHSFEYTFNAIPLVYHVDSGQFDEKWSLEYPEGGVTAK
jgi:hypothetical protein